MEGSVWGSVLAVLFMGAFQLCGLVTARAVLPRESTGIRLLLGSIWGSTMLQWFPVLFAFPLGFTLPAQGCALGLALLWGTGMWCWGRRRGVPRWDFQGALETLSRKKFLWVVLGTWVFFCYLVIHSFRWEGGAVFSSQATYGDMSMHLSFITSLARQGDFPPDYSLLPGTRLSYPFLSDSISSSLYQLGAPLVVAYAMPMMVAGAQVLLGVYAFVFRMTETKGRAALAWTLFFFNGGFGFLYFLGGSLENFTRIFTAFYETPTNLIGENIRWVNVLVDMMLPQRATLFGWALLFSALYLLYRGTMEGQRDYFLPVGIMAGAMPMIHTHSFLALGLICGVWLIFSLCANLHWGAGAAGVGKALIVVGLVSFSLLKEWVRGREESPVFLWAALGVLLLCLALIAFLVGKTFWKKEGLVLLPRWGILLGAAGVLALPQLLYWTFQQAGEGSFLRGHFGWVIGEDGYLWFYLKNLGLTAVLAVIGLLTARNRDFMKYAPALALWLLAELVEFQPNDYDNNKLLYPAFAFLCCSAAEGLVRCLTFLKNPKAQRGAVAGVVAVASLSGGLTLGREAVASYELFGRGAVELAHYVEEATIPNAVILTDTRHNNEIAALAGRNVVCGSPSYLFYHGLNYQKNQQAAQAIYEDPWGNRSLLDQLQVDYILVSDYERASYQVDEAALDRMYARVYDDGSRVLYQVTEQEDTP